MITKIAGKTYREVEPISEKVRIRDRINEINDLIQNEKTRRDVHIANIQKFQLEKDILQVELTEINK